MIQTAATFLVKAPSLNALSGFDPPHQRQSQSHLHQSAASKVFRHRSILVHVPPSTFSSSAAATIYHKSSCSSSSGGGSSKGNSSRSNISILAAIAATAWQPHGAYQTRPRSVHVQSISQIARVRSNFTRCHDRPLPFAVPSVTTVIVSSDGSSAIRAIWFMYNRPPGNM